MNNLSLFPNSNISVHIIDEINVVAAIQPMDSIPGNFIDIELVRQPQVFSNFNEQDLLWEPSQPRQYPAIMASSVSIARFTRSSSSPATDIFVNRSIPS
jgi:hypothetical protein